MKLIRRITLPLTQTDPLFVAIILFTGLLALLLQAILAGYSSAWTGFGDYTTPTGEFMRAKTLWDWTELLIIPFVLAIGAFALNRSERAVEREIAEDRAALERTIATDRQQEAALQSYLDRMADLLLREKLRTTRNKEVRDVARIRTLTALRGLDGTRKGLVLRFLIEANLLAKEKTIVDLTGADLNNAGLNHANLADTFLRGVELRHALLAKTLLHSADLSNADLSNADLNSANLSSANLRDADLRDADLRGADLRGADLRGADLRGADLTGADLTGANLRAADLSIMYSLSGDVRTRVTTNVHHANLSKVNLTDADLTDANLEGAEVTNRQLATAKSLTGAIMPDRTKHE
jgi:uncharacterized protein YjbI with pentapeptide repeats